MADGAPESLNCLHLKYDSPILVQFGEKIVLCIFGCLPLSTTLVAW